MRCAGVLATHFHPDHVGGDLMGYRIEGVTDLLEATCRCPSTSRRPRPRGWCGPRACRAASSSSTSSGDVVMVGDVDIELVHTPGHTPGSQCFSVDGRLVAGDTLFLDGCGRTDLPGGDPEQMYESLTTRLARFGDDTMLYPGHLYSPEPSATMGETRQRNYVFRLRSPPNSG